MDEVLASFKKNLGVDFKYFFVVFRGIDGFASSVKKYAAFLTLPRFVSLLQEKSAEFYKEQRRKIKKKLTLREKMPTSQLSILKSYARLGMFYEFTRKTAKVFKYFRLCFSFLCQLHPQLKKAFDVWEIKAFADCIMLKFVKAQLSVNEARQAIAVFCIHYTTFKQQAGEMNPKYEYMVRILRMICRNINGEQCS